MLDTHIDTTPFLLHLVENRKGFFQHFFKWAAIFGSPESLTEVDQKCISVFIEIDVQLLQNMLVGRYCLSVPAVQLETVVFEETVEIAFFTLMFGI